MNYKRRLADAKSTYKVGRRRVVETPAPEKQKFPVGSFVKIAKDLGSCMSHFQNDCFARVECTYEHAYPTYDGDQYKTYSLYTKRSCGKWYTVAWYKEHQLELVEDEKLLKELEDDFEYGD